MGLILGVLAAVGGGPADTSLAGMALVSTFAMMLVLGIATADVENSLKQARVTIPPLSTRADRVGLRHDGGFRTQGTVSELTRTLPAAIRFSLPPSAPVPPLQQAPVADRIYLIETFDVQQDLKQLLDWADAHAVHLHGLSAAPTRLDDVLRAIDAEPTTALTAA